MHKIQEAGTFSWQTSALEKFKLQTDHFTCVLNFHLTGTAMNLLFLVDSLLERHLSILPVAKVSVLERVNSNCT